MKISNLNWTNGNVYTDVYDRNLIGIYVLCMHDLLNCVVPMNFSDL